MKIAVLTSGGVDSSVALHRLHREGHELHAFYLKVWLEDELADLGHCPWEEDLAHVREICRRFGVPVEVIPLQTEYRERVVEYVLAELREGRTPSPDVHCNRHIKFGAFLDAVDPGFERVASGHYARLVSRGNETLLLRGLDRVKDQTYFLSHLRSGQLRRSLFPLGGLEKREVRRLAHELELPNRDRPDSQGICFLGKIDYRDFVRHHLGEKEGKVVEAESGKILGRHPGYWFFTIGQRHGLGLGGGPWYVCGKEVGDNVLFVTHAERLEDHVCRTFTVRRLHWLAGHPPARSGLEVKVRHGSHLHPAHVELRGEEEAVVHLEDGGEAGIAPGQFAVFYDEEVCLGAATIIER